MTNSSFSKTDYYPEQFDVTFKFVPMMCENRQCKVCFWGPLGVKDICLAQEGRLCSVAMITCGYTFTCTKENCIIYKNMNNYKGLCKAPEIFGIVK